MSAVFGDTSFFVALISSRDRHHQRARELNATLAAPLVTTAWVLLEFANGIAKSQSRGEFGGTLANLRSQPDAEIIPPDQPLFDRGCELYMSRPDKQWSLTDCISFVVMRERGIIEALSNDHHFEQAGFRILLKVD